VLTPRAAITRQPTTSGSIGIDAAAATPAAASRNPEEMSVPRCRRSDSRPVSMEETAITVRKTAIIPPAAA